MNINAYMADSPQHLRYAPKVLRYIYTLSYGFCQGFFEVSLGFI